jgi:cell wall-associated NlpC family hydrolase
MTDTEIAAFVGIRYKDDGRDMTGFNCWGLLHYVQRKFYNRDLPMVSVHGGFDLSDMHSGCLSDGTYRQVSEAIDGDCVLLRGGENPHVGVYLSNDGGGVLHSVAGMGVIWTPIHQLNGFGYARRIYYRVRENDRETCSGNKSFPPDD